MITPDFIGQRYKDTNTGNIWIANSVTPGDWTLEVQNYLAWTPGSTVPQFGLMEYTGTADLISLIWNVETIYGDTDLESQSSLISVSLPKLIAIDPLGTSLGSSFYIVSNALLSSFSAPNLVTVNSVGLNVYNNALTALDLSSLVSCSEDLNLSNNPLISILLPSLVSAFAIKFNGCSFLQTVSMPVFLPTNGRAYRFDGCALTDTSVNHILARGVANAAFVSGSIRTDLGTSAAPSGQGIADKATLIGRGVTVTTN